MSARTRLASALGVSAGGVLVVDLALALGGRGRARRLTKPLLMPLLAGRLLAQSGSQRTALRDRTLAALLCSTAGDAVILGESGGALAGAAACFAAAQIGYVRGFRAAGSRPGPAATAAIAGSAVAGVATYWPHAGRLRPVLAGYPPLLATMAVYACGLGGSLPAPAARRIATGAGVFLASDTIVGAQRFLDLSPRQRTALEVPAMVSYFAAQWLIADGVARATRGRR